MKALLFVALMLNLTLAIAQEDPNLLTDLQVITLTGETSEKNYMLSYPGINGDDCLVLDLRQRNRRISLTQKRSLANKLLILDGFGEDKVALRSTLKGDKVVFNLASNGNYTTRLDIKTKSGKSFNDVLVEAIREVDYNTIAGLIYVEGCRL